MRAVVLCNGANQLTCGIMLPVIKTGVACIKNYLISIVSACVCVCVRVCVCVLLFGLSIAV